jgi:hypothetical protein
MKAPKLESSKALMAPIGSTIYGGRAPTTVVALIVGALGAFLSLKGYVWRV